MEIIKDNILKISVHTEEIKIRDVQEILKIMQELSHAYGSNNEFLIYCDAILEVLWHHMDAGWTEFDDQLLCSTCFYTILTFSNEKEFYLEKVLKLLNIEIDLKEKGMDCTNISLNTISLTYGLFQSSILQQKPEKPILVDVLKKTFTSLTLKAYEYSQYTYITFKIMTLFRKVTATVFQDIIFNKDNNVKLLNLINHNWENPITGVRALNKIIFNNLVSMMDESLFEVVEQRLTGFYWNKAKYLMLAEIIEQPKSNSRLLSDKYDLVQGLLYSLNKDGLVSAGADMYVAVIKKVTTEEEWCNIFLGNIIKMIKGSSIKPIKHFFNYWFINTLKKFPELSIIIFDEVCKLDIADHKLYSCLCIIQQGNKLGILEKYFNNSKYRDLILTNLDHIDVHIRVMAFDIMCRLYRTFLPKDHYNVIIDFLYNNINSDSHILRINTVKSFQTFLVQLHIIFAKNVSNLYNKECEVINALLIFCKNLQKFIVESLNFDGNYQRKIATIQITKVMLNTFKSSPEIHQKASRQLQSPLTAYIKNSQQWILSEKQFILKLINLLKDPSDDVREHVKEVLLHNYSKQLCEGDLIRYLTEEALLCTRSKFFYEISCGQTIFKLIANLLLIENVSDGLFKNVEDIFDFAYAELTSECNRETDIVKSIIGGKQFHSYLNILYCVFDVSLDKLYELNIPMTVICSLIAIMKCISNHFTWEEGNLISSDFSKMNDMIKKIIENSEHQIRHDGNETAVSGLHQIVLNCLWLNVKSTCELSAILIRYYNNKNSNTELCENCLNIICNVLETSRHKGAIEAAGTALGQAIQQLTSLHANPINSELPMLLLKNKLNQLVLETNRMASVTRRGAGLSIMIHRIVSSDMKKRKPLFHYFMHTLLETCNKVPEYDSEVSTSYEKDLPKAIYIHFLTKIVTDSSLASDIMYYSGKLAQLAFDNLCSSCWQIRNAALQLYGSLIPKLIGQKKNSGVSEEVGATVAVDEFRTHSPRLWGYIEAQLNIATHHPSSYDIVHSHNNLVPMLSILANLAPVYSFTSGTEVYKKILQNLLNLLGSPIYVVRRLVSKCILNIYDLEEILHALLSITGETENYLHGSLMLLKQFKEQCNVKEEILNDLYQKYKSFMSRKRSYLSRELFESTFPEYINLTEKLIRETLSEMHVNSNSPGLFLWANFRIKSYLESASWENIPHIVKLISKCSDCKAYYEILCNRLEVEKRIQNEILLQLSTILYSSAFNEKSKIVWKILYKISLHTQSLNKHLDISLIQQYLLNNKVSFGTRYMIAFAARVFMNNISGDLISLSNIIFNLCDPEIDVDMRLIAAIANNELAGYFRILPDNAKINTIKAATLLLQDEDEDVRKLSVDFYKTVNMDETAVHPYICWRKILSSKFLHKVLYNPQTAIQTICSDLLELLDLFKSKSLQNDDEYNPFINNSKNIYLEPEVLRKALCDLKSS